ncbi:MAG: aminopeptidase N [Pseudomonadota bacterium]
MQPVTRYRLDYAPPEFTIDAVEMVVDVAARDCRVKSTLTLRRLHGEGALRLQGENLRLEAVHLENRQLRESDFRIENGELEIPKVPDRFQLTTVSTFDPADNTALEGFYQSGEFLLTQCEAEGFRKITWFLDRPDVMARYSVRMQADRERYPVLLCNGNLTAAGPLDGGRHFALWEDPFPKPSYLFAMVAGELTLVEDHYTSSKGRTVALKIYVEDAFRDQVDHAMDSLKRAMVWDEKRFGLHYDLDVYHIVATSDFNMGAMENKSLNIFNTRYVLAAADTATDQDFEDVEGVIGHEYFHNWTGNRVTCRDWFQLSLKEGLTVFRDQEFTADLHSRALKRIDDVRVLRAAQFPEDSGPMAHPVRPDSYQEINNFYTMTVYQKGAEVVRMLHTLLGEEGFQRGMAEYIERHDGKAVTCDDFRASMAVANRRDLDQFERWYLQAGTPVLTASGEYDAGTYRLTLRQHTPATPGQADKQPLHIPVRMALLDASGKDMVLRRAEGSGPVLELTEAQQTFTFYDVPEAPQVSLLRGFSAPVRVEWEQGAPDLAFLMAHDSDPFNRWDAGQALATAIILSGVGGASDRTEAYLAAAGEILEDRELDPALVAEALRLPDLATLAELIRPVPIDALHQGRESLGASLGTLHRDLLRDRYDDAIVTRAYQPRARHAARRRLNGQCLALLAAAGETDLALSQYERARNMTDRYNALAPLVRARTEAAPDLLADFYERFSAYPLVMDKWLTLQASVPAEDTLDRVQALMASPIFSLRNPNKVRALLGTFSRNLTSFHAPDGEGYRFVADQVLALNALNPQVSARLVSAFNNWRRFDETRRGAAQAQLERMLAHPGLSSDVYEIVSKALSQVKEEAA